MTLGDSNFLLDTEASPFLPLDSSIRLCTEMARIFLVSRYRCLQITEYLDREVWAGSIEEVTRQYCLDLVRD
jgi:hypothetical protein